MRLCIGQFGEDLKISSSTLFHYIKELNRARPVRMGRRGKQVECWVSPQPLEQLSVLFGELPSQSQQGPKS